MAALAKVSLMMGRAIVPAVWAQACPPPPPACCCQPTREQPWEALGESCSSPPSAPCSPRGGKMSGVGRGFASAPQDEKGGNGPTAARFGCLAAAMLREVSLRSRRGRQGGCEHVKTPVPRITRMKMNAGGTPGCNEGCPGHCGGWAWLCVSLGRGCLSPSPALSSPLPIGQWCYDSQDPKCGECCPVRDGGCWGCAGCGPLCFPCLAALGSSGECGLEKGEFTHITLRGCD